MGIDPSQTVTCRAGLALLLQPCWFGTARYGRQTETNLAINLVPCDNMGNDSVHVPCQQGFLCSSLLSGRDVPGRYAQYSFSPVTVNEAGLNISFTLGSIVRNVTLNGEHIITQCY